MINVEHATSEKPNLYSFGRSGKIANILPESSRTGICVEWTRFSLKQLCSVDYQWKEEIIHLYYYLCSYYASENNIEVTLQLDLSPCLLTKEEMRDSEPLFGGNCDVAVIMYSGVESPRHYVLFKIDHENHIGYLYDSMSNGQNKINKNLKKQIFDYLKKNKFIHAQSRLSNVKWPGIVCRKQQNFLVHLVLQENHYIMSNKITYAPGQSFVKN